MKIQNQVTTQKVVSVSYEDYLDYCRTKFGIVESADGVDEIQAITESTQMTAHSTWYDRDLTDINVRKEVSEKLMKLYRDAANYIELLQAHVELVEKERKEKAYREHQESLVGH